MRIRLSIEDGKVEGRIVVADGVNGLLERAPLDFGEKIGEFGAGGQR